MARANQSQQAPAEPSLHGHPLIIYSIGLYSKIALNLSGRAEFS